VIFREIQTLLSLEASVDESEHGKTESPLFFGLLVSTIGLVYIGIAI
jgi:hypothetical protein